jgi:hypothetical protein
MNKRMRSKLSQQDIELFNKIVMDVQPLRKTYNSQVSSNLNQVSRQKSQDIITTMKFSKPHIISKKKTKTIYTFS